MHQTGNFITLQQTRPGKLFLGFQGICQDEEASSLNRQLVDLSNLTSDFSQTAELISSPA